MTLLTYYLLSAGCGLIQFMSVTSKSQVTNRLASMMNIVGIVLIAIIGIKNFDVLTTLSGILTIFLVGMVLSFLFLKLMAKIAPPKEEDTKKQPPRKKNKKKKR